MTHKIDMIMDFQYGSTGKGLIAGYLAKRETYDTAVCAFSANAGHTYIDKSRGLHVMTQQLPTAITSPTVRNILIGPGAAICPDTLMAELCRYDQFIQGKRILIHPHAAVIDPGKHQAEEYDMGMAKIGSTTKGVGAAYIERIKRQPNANTAHNRWVRDTYSHVLRDFVTTIEEYNNVLQGSENVIVEGAQGFSLSMYHGQYPYTTSRDVTPWQIAADCGLPYKWASYIQVIGTLRTFPIRVNNREGTSGPCYSDQTELEWSAIGVEPELTTVTKLPRRIFTFSQDQLQQALFNCGGYWNTRLFLNFANYMELQSLRELVNAIRRPKSLALNPPKVEWLGFGPDDENVRTLDDCYAAGIL
jgi:adenylosuccinate synthase